MKTIIKRKWLLIILSAFLLGASVFGLLFSNGFIRNTVEAETTAEAMLKNEEIDTVLNKSAFNKATSSIYLTKGASMRISSATPGMRFTAEGRNALQLVGDSIVPASIDEELNTSEATVRSQYNLYHVWKYTVKRVVEGEEKVGYVYKQASFTEGAWATKFYGAVTFEGFTEAQFNNAKVSDISATVLVVGLPKDAESGLKAFYIDDICPDNDNTRSMEYIVNMAMVNGEDKIYDGVNEITVTDNGKVNYIAGQVNSDKAIGMEVGCDMTAQSWNENSTNAKVITPESFTLTLPEGVTASKIYEGTYTDELTFNQADNVLTIDNESINKLYPTVKSNILETTTITIAVKGSDGKYYNFTNAKYVTKVIDDEKDLEFFDLNNNASTQFNIC